MHFMFSVFDFYVIILHTFDLLKGYEGFVFETYLAKKLILGVDAVMAVSTIKQFNTFIFIMLQKWLRFCWIKISVSLNIYATEK